MLAPLRKGRDGSYRTKLRLLVDPALLSPDLDLFAWSVPHWPHVSIYGGNVVGIGAGYRLFSLLKADYIRRFGMCCADGKLQLLPDGCAWAVMKRNDDNQAVNGLD